MYDDTLHKYILILYIYIYVCVCVCVCVCVFMCLCVCVCVCMCVFMWVYNIYIFIVVKPQRTSNTHLMIYRYTKKTRGIINNDLMQLFTIADTKV